MTLKKLIIPVLVTIIGGSVLFASVNAIHAQENGPFTGLAQAIASKFGLSESDVQSEIDSYMQTQRQNMQGKMQDMVKTKLDSLVSSGKITSDQETAIINELAALKLKYMTGTPDKANFQNMQTDWTNWLKSQNIDQSVLGKFGMFGLGGMRGNPHGGWNKPTSSPPPTP